MGDAVKSVRKIEVCWCLWCAVLKISKLSMCVCVCVYVYLFRIKNAEAFDSLP